jgi:hypothetical protein
MRLAPVLLALLAAAAVEAQDLRPDSLRVEHRVAPVGLDAERPRMSWALVPTDADARGGRQSAYQVRVTRGDEDVWDSGRVESDDQHLVPYAGPALEPGRTYAWDVRVWDGDGEPSDWARSSWTTGRLGDWGGARWIGLDSLLADEIGLGRTGTPRLRRDFRVEKPVARALVHVTGLGHYVLWANGERVGDDRLAPGWTEPAKSVLYNTYDVTEHVRQGENALGIGLGGGLYRIPQGGPHAEGRYAKYWDSIGPLQALVHLTVEHPDGTTTVVTSDGSWTAGASPTVFSSIWGGEDYDARRETPGWARPGFASTGAAPGWRPVRVLPGPGGTLRAQTSPPLRAHETFRAVETTEPEPGVFVVDLGQNHSGMPRLTVRGEAGQRVTLRPAEVVLPSGLVDQTSMKHWGEILFHYTLEGDSVETWQPDYTYTGYRYVQVEGAAMTAADAAARGVPHVVAVESDWVHAAAPLAGTLETSNDLVNGVHGMIVGAIRSNMQHVMTDCPHREKLGWLEEAYLMGPSIFYNYAVAPLYAKWTEDMVEAQEPSGLVPTTAPEYTFFGGNFRDSPEWGSAVVQVPWLLRVWAGDEAPLRRHYDDMARYADYLSERAGDDGVIRYGLGDWYDVGPAFPGESQLTSKGVTATATQAANLAVLAEMADLLDRPRDARLWRARRFDLFGAFNRAFWDAETGYYDTGSQTAQAMPLVLGLVPSARQPAALATLVADVEGRGYHPTAGDVGHRYFVQALHAAGRSDVLWRLATQTEAPSYGAQLLAGATTLTEAWDANPVQSQNHFMLGHLEEWFWGGLAGLQPLDPGWRRFRVAPEVVGDLTFVTASHRTPYGETASRWRRDGSALTLEVTVPVGSVAEVGVPAASAEVVREGGVPAAEVPGLTVLGYENGRAVFEAAPGRYTFTSTLP